MRAPDIDCTEKSFQAKVCRLALHNGWRYCHVPPAYVRGKWQTLTQGSEGFPDLVLARDGVVLLVELKSEKGRLRPGQREWIDTAGSNGFIWRPSDWDLVVETLTQE